MLSLRTCSSFSLPFSPSKHLRHAKPLSPFKPHPQCPPSRTRSSIKMSSTQAVEHVVLFKVKDDTEPSKVNAMVNGLSSLVSLDGVLHLTAGPLLRNGSTSSDLRFTHMLHSRYNSKEDLEAYSAHPSHLGVVRGSVLPICDDLMAVDWVAEGGVGGSALPPLQPRPPGSAIRVSFLKLKENVGDEVKNEVLGVVRGIKDSVGEISQLSWGENFSPARAKGFSIASLAVFPGRRELEGVDSNEGLVKVREHLESVVVVDYVVPSRVVQSASFL